MLPKQLLTMQTGASNLTSTS